MMDCYSGQGEPSPTGDGLRNLVERASKLYLEISWKLGVLLHYPHSQSVEDCPGGINWCYCLHLVYDC